MDDIASLGMPTTQNVDADAAQAASLSSSDPKAAASLDQSAKDVFNPILTQGLSNPPASEVPTIDMLAPATPGTPQTVDLSNLPTSHDMTQAIANLSMTPLATVASDLVASLVQSDLSPKSFNSYDQERIKALDQDFYSYSGSDLKVIVEVAGGQGYKQLVELSTITTSIHREKAIVRACSYINPKGFAYGRRTIAGTIVLTQFWMDSLLRFLATNGKGAYSQAGTAFWESDAGAADLSYNKVDQLPSLNFTFLFADEYGHSSVRQILGATLETDGTVYSVNDQFTEQTITYKALDFTPLQPVDAVGKLREFAQQSKTPGDAYAQTWLTPSSNAPATSNVPLNLSKNVTNPIGTAARATPTSAGAALLPPFMQQILKGNG